MADTGTPYNSIFDQFYMFLEDYKLVSLFNTSEEDYTTYLTGWLKPSIVEFKRNGCVQDLTQRDDDAKTFNIVLEDETLVILARLMVKYWYEKQVNDANQFRQYVDDRDFKRTSPGMALQSKQSTLDRVREDCSQELISYGYAHAPWDEWRSGNFA